MRGVKPSEPREQFISCVMEMEMGGGRVGVVVVGGDTREERVVVAQKEKRP